MSRAKHLLADAPTDRVRGRKPTIEPDVLADVMAAYDRGVSVRSIWTRCDGQVTPFPPTVVALQSYVAREAKRRRKAAAK